MMYDYWYTYSLAGKTRVGIITGETSEDAITNISKRHPNRTNIVLECEQTEVLIKEKQIELCWKEVDLLSKETYD